jgi:hypothetical protein
VADAGQAAQGTAAPDPPPRQKELYEVALGVHDVCIENYRPGTTYSRDWSESRQPPPGSCAMMGRAFNRVGERDAMTGLTHGRCA